MFRKQYAFYRLSVRVNLHFLSIATPALLDLHLR